MKQTNSNPNHVAIIIDGNRRFAKRLMLEPWKGHEYGKQRVEELLDYAKELGIKEMTFYALSVENIKSRPSKELEFLYKLFKKVFIELDREKVHNNQIRIKFIGNLSLLPLDLKDLCKNLEKETENYDDLIVNFAIAYGGRQEITEAVKKIIKNKIPSENINEQTIEELLLLQSQPDLVIRTGGEQRTSNFLPWQTTYSELLFINKMWPEFEKQDFVNCLEEFKQRKRRFGK